MSKFSATYKAVFSIFGSDSWKAESIKVFPRGVDTSGEEFAILDIIPSNRGTNKNSLNGQILLEVYVQGGSGPGRMTAIVDTLDKYLTNRIIHISEAESLQLYASTLANFRTETDSGMLGATVTVPFNYFSLGN